MQWASRSSKKGRAEGEMLMGIRKGFKETRTEIVI